MLLMFELRMPGVNSWNGRWSGENKRHIKVTRVGAKCAAKPGTYSYDFGDGWRASVEVREVSGKEARALRRLSSGFCGYDWMCDDIRFLGRIRTLKERAEARRAVQEREAAQVAPQSEQSRGTELEVF